MYLMHVHRIQYKKNFLLYNSESSIIMDLEKIIEDYTRELTIPNGATNITTILKFNSITFFGLKV